MEQQSRWPWRQIPAQVNSGPANTLPDRAISPAANCPTAQQAGCGCQALLGLGNGSDQHNCGQSLMQLGSSAHHVFLFFLFVVETHTVDSRVITS